MIGWWGHDLSLPRDQRERKSERRKRGINSEKQKWRCQMRKEWSRLIYKRGGKTKSLKFCTVASLQKRQCAQQWNRTITLFRDDTKYVKRRQTPLIDKWAELESLLSPSFVLAWGCKGFKAPPITGVNNALLLFLLFCCRQAHALIGPSNLGKQTWLTDGWASLLVCCRSSSATIKVTISRHHRRGPPIRS